MDIRYSYGPVPTIRRFAQSDAFMRGLIGGFGTGKSSGCVMEIPRRAQRQMRGPDGLRHTRWAVIRGSYRQLTDTTIKTLHQWMPPHLFGEFSVTTMTYTIRALDGCDCEILFRALDRDDHVDNLLSLELTGAWINEARETPWRIVEALQGRLGRWPPQRDGGATWYGLWMDTNPPDSDSHWYKFFEEWLPGEEGLATNASYLRDHGRAFAEIFKQPSGLSSAAENLENLPGGRAYYETMAVGKDPEWIRVYIDGDYGFVIDGKPVFPEYSDTVHCSEKAVPTRGEPIYRGWDWGLTGACVLLQQNSFGQIIVLDELLSEGAGIESFADDVLAHCTKFWSKTKLGWEPEWIDVGDPAGQARVQTDEKTCFQIMASKGVTVEAGLQTPAIRLECVRKPLSTMRNGRPGFLLHPRCRTLRKGFLGGYQYRKMNTRRERYTERPDKNEYSHPHDALQYPLTILFGAALTTEKRRPVRPGDDSLDYVDVAGRDDTTGY